MISQLSEELNPDTSELNRIAAALNLDQKFLTTLHRSSAGGGNPEEPFLNKVSNRYYTEEVNRLIGSVPDEFDNVKKYISDLKVAIGEEGYTLGKFLSLSRVYKIAEKIRGLGPDASDLCWKQMATNMGFESKDIKKYEAKVKINYQYSPCDALFNHLTATLPDMPLYSIYMEMQENCKKIMADAMIGMLMNEN